MESLLSMLYITNDIVCHPPPPPPPNDDAFCMWPLSVFGHPKIYTINHFHVVLEICKIVLVLFI